MGQKTRGNLLRYTGLLLTLTAPIIGLGLPTIRWYVLFLIIPILPAFVMAIYLKRDLGALAIGVWLLVAIILPIPSFLHELELHHLLFFGYLFAGLLILGIILIILSLKPERGYVVERVKSAVLVIVLLNLITASFFYPPSVKVSLKVSDMYVLYHLILLFALPLIFTLAWIIQARIRKRVQELILSESWINTSLAMFAVGMYSISMFIMGTGAMCGCGCFAYISPGVPMVMHSLIAPSTALLMGHIYAERLGISKSLKNEENQ